jgi:hypothetical protein
MHFVLYDVHGEPMEDDIPDEVSSNLLDDSCAAQRLPFDLEALLSSLSPCHDSTLVTSATLMGQHHHVVREAHT